MVSFLSFQRIGVPIHLAVFNGDYGIEGLEIVPDAAGVDEKRLAPPVHQGAVGMAEKQQVRLFLLRLIPGPEQGLLYPQGVAVAEEDALVLDKEETLRLLKGAVIAVAGDLLQGDVRKALLEPLGVPPAVSQMEDEPGLDLFHRLNHVVYISVGIGENQDLHKKLLFGSSFSIGYFSASIKYLENPLNTS